MELGLAIYAALVGTAAFGWSVYQWVRGRRPDVLVLPGASASSSSGRKVQATVVNRGTHPIRIGTYSFRRPNVDPHQVWFNDELAPIPPSDAVMVEVPLDEVVDWKAGDELVAEVELTTGDTFRSRPYVPPF